MNIDMTKEDATLTVALSGRLDTQSAPELEEKLSSAYEGINKLIFDFEDLSYISSAGLRILLNAMQTMDNHGELLVKNVNDDIMSVFNLTGFIEDLTII